MYRISRVLLSVVFVTAALAQSADPPLSDSRLSVHTLLREDIFAGFLTDDMERFSRGEKNVQLLLEQRPIERPSLLAWRGSANYYRAVRANEDNRAGDFQKYYRLALDSFSEAGAPKTQNGAVAAIVGGSHVVLADRLPKEYRAAAWSQAYDSYLVLWKQQAPIVDKLPVHIRGELLGGLAQSAQRTGRTDELAQYLDKILTVLAGTPYERAARRWKENPNAAASASITCLTCHEAGRLDARIAALKGQ